MATTSQQHGSKFTSNMETGERRRRARVAGVTQGWLIPDTGETADPWEVRVSNVSRMGVGFESSTQIHAGEVVRIRIGRGPLHLARRVRIVSCRATSDRGTYIIGGEFVSD